MSDQQRDPLESVEPSRRSFIKKMAAVAFVAPVVSSFGMESLASASGGNQTFPNQTFPNQPPCDPPPPCDDDKDRKRKRKKRKKHR